MIKQVIRHKFYAIPNSALTHIFAFAAESPYEQAGPEASVILTDTKKEKKRKGSQDLVARTWKRGSGSQDLLARIW